MKLNSKPSKITIIWSIIIIIFGAISGLAVWQLTDREEMVNEPEYTPRKVQKPVEEPAPKNQIILPGAEPITAIDGDYAADDHIWRLVNKTHPLGDIHYSPEVIKPNVATRPDKSIGEQSVRADIATHVEELFTAARAAGHELKIGSGFRNYDVQNMYYTNYVRSYGQASADRFSAKPGHSEHQTGLAIDVATLDNHCYLETCFGQTEAGKWLAEHANQYGFILRYPEGKEEVTGFQYEPWHFRYIGKNLAKAILQSGLTLDQAAPYLNTTKE